MPQRLTPKIIEAAIDGFEHKKQQLMNEFDAQIAELRAMLPGANTQPTTTPEAPPPKRKKFSAAARRKMALAQKARWAKIRGESEPPVPAATPELAKPKRKLSAAGRAAIIAATKKRWALKRAEAAKAQRVAKKSAPARRKGTAKRAVKTAPAAAPTAQPVG